jgi:hypothetical protein
LTNGQLTGTAIAGEERVGPLIVLPLENNLPVSLIFIVMSIFLRSIFNSVRPQVAISYSKDIAIYIRIFFFQGEDTLVSLIVNAIVDINSNLVFFLHDLLIYYL